MSTTVDNRVVEMQFDNKQFERNVQTSMSTLDKLKQSLNFTGVAKGFDNIDRAAKSVNFSALSSGVEAVGLKFNAMYTIADQALRNIVNTAYRAGERITKALTIDPIKTGFAEYETQINAVQTILANTQSKGTTIDDVNGALDELNTYADKTIYNFTEMTRNIGTFTAAGVDLDKSVTSIKGIANLAAVSGSTSQQASTAMYQLSQALAAGKVSLMDWNSVVNAGMGGQVFQDALKRTAENMGTNVDALIKKYGSFRESLTQGEWLTAEVLTETLTQLSGAYSKADLIAQGYSEKQAQEILDLAKTAEDAATKVKTFTQLWDTLKESAQSGWTQTWEIIVGDFEEAKGTLTKVSDVLGEMIGNSAESRNAMLQGWKDLGGRDALIEAISNAFEGLMSIIKPIKEAFREIFPPITSEQLYKFTDGLRKLTEKFIRVDEVLPNTKNLLMEYTAGAKEASEHNAKIAQTINNVKRTFKGVFAAIDIVVEAFKALGKGALDLIGNFSGVGGGILEATANIGDWIVNLRDSIKEGNAFGKTVDKITGFVSKVIDRIKEFGKSLDFSFNLPECDGFLNFLNKVWEVVKYLGSKVGDVFASIGRGIWEALGSFDFTRVLNSGLFATLLISSHGVTAKLKGIIDDLKDTIGSFSSGSIFDRLKDSLSPLFDTLQAYQNSLNAETLKKIAISIGILAASIFVIGTIDADALDRSLGAIAILFGELLGSLAIFQKMSGSMKGVVKAMGLMTSMSISIVILASALKILSTIDSYKLANGLVGIGVLMAELALFLNFAKFDGKMTRTAVGIVVLSGALLIMAKAVKSFGEMDWGTLGRGLAGVAGALGAVVLAMKLMPKNWTATIDGFGSVKSTAHLVSAGIMFVAVAGSMKIFASAMKDFAQLEWEEIGKGLAGIAGSLLAVVGAMRLMPKNVLGNLSANMVGFGVGMIAMSAAMLILVEVVRKFNEFSWEELAKGLGAIAVSMFIFSKALASMTGSIGGAASLLVAAGALVILASAIKTLSDISIEGIFKSLTIMAGAFFTVGVAGMFLGPMIPTILGLAGAFALFGIATLGIGAGIGLIAAGLVALGTAGTVGAAALVSALTIIVLGIADLIPEIILTLGDGIRALCTVIAECAPEIAVTILEVIAEVLAALVKYTPQIVDSLMKFVIGVLDAFAENLPQLIVSAVNVIGAFFQGIVDALSGIDTTTLLKGIAGVGLLSILMIALNAVAGLIPGAMIGVLGMGVLVAELAIVLAAIGAFAQIPGLQWLIAEGGDFLQTIGTAIGQFIGGIAGGIAEGATSTLPQIGTNLSDFMTNVQPFIDGAKQLDASMLEGVRALADTILILTAANLLDGITSFITGGASIASFGTELANLGTSLNQFATNLGTFDDSKVNTVTCAANAVKAMAQAASEIPNEGGWAAKIFGDNSIASFSAQLPELATNLNAFATNLGTFDETKIAAVSCAGEAIKALATAANEIDGQADWAKKIFGDNSITAFGEQLPDLGTNLGTFATNLGTFDENKLSTVKCAGEAIKALAQASNGIDGQADWAKKIFGDNSLGTFGEQLGDLGSDLSTFAENLGTFNEAKVATVKSAVAAIEALTGLADADLKGAKKNLTDFGSELPDFAKSVGSFVDNMPSGDSITSAIDNVKKIIKMIDDIAKAEADSIANFTKSLGKIGKDGVQKFVEAFTSSAAKSDVKKAGEGLITQIIKGAEAKENTLKTTFKESAAACAKAIKDKWQSFYDAGKYLVEGFRDGISANTFKAEAKARAMAKAAAKAAEDALDINSPSKVGFGIGNFFGMGFVNALETYANKAYRASSDMAESARTGLSDSIDKFNSVANSDIDLQPVIRPVLDLSDVRSRAGSIGSLLNAGSSVGVLANVASTSAMMNRYSQHSQNGEVVSAIDKLRKELGNVGGTTYNVNGITYDDGSNIANAVKDLIGAARRERRM